MTVNTSIKFFDSISYDKDSWRDRANCKTVAPSIFFLDKDDKNALTQVKKICNSCPVQQECLDYAIQNTERFGIWGGLGYRGRLKYARKNNILRNQ